MWKSSWQSNLLPTRTRVLTPSNCDGHVPGQYFTPVADPDQDYRGLSTGQIFKPKELAELKLELSKVVARIYSLFITAYLTLFLRITTSKIPGVFCRPRRKYYPISFHIGNTFNKSLFIFSITCCIPSEPYWVCNLQRLSYPASTQIFLFPTQYWGEPCSDMNIPFHPIKHRPNQSSLSVCQLQC